MSLTQDVAVRVLTGPQAEEYREPLVPEPQVRFLGNLARIILIFPVTLMSV